MLEIPAGKIMLPFMLAATAGVVPAPELNKTRMAEAVIIGLIVASGVALGGKYIALPVLEDWLATVIKDSEQTRLKVEQLQEKIVALQIEMARIKR